MQKVANAAVKQKDVETNLQTNYSSTNKLQIIPLRKSLAKLVPEQFRDPSILSKC